MIKYKTFLTTVFSMWCECEFNYFVNNEMKFSRMVPIKYFNAFKHSLSL